MQFSTVFLDRDGVVNRRLPGDYVRNQKAFEFLPDVQEALRLMTEAGLRLIIITNQRGIARGLMTEADLQAVHTLMLAELEKAGAHIAAIYHCPHDKDECQCRKPEPGMLLQAQSDFPEIEFSDSILIGDSLSDMQAGRRVGCHTLLIASDTDDTRTETEDQAAALATKGSAPSLYLATRYLLRQAHE